MNWAGACALCAPGSFSTGLGAATCDDCGAAAFLARDAAPGERACVPCPGNASAVPRALGVEGCVALAGFVRVAGAGARVELAVLWPGSAAAFAAAEAAFRRGLAAAGAAACGCGAASARVARVTAAAAAAARRLLQDFVEGVVVEVELGVADAGSGAQLAASLTAAGINAALAQEGVAPVSAIVSGPTLLASAEFGPCPADAYCPTQDTVVACPPNTTAPAGSAREEQCWCLAGFAGAARFSLTLFLRACFSTSKHGGLVSVSVLGLVWSRPWGWTLFPSGPAPGGGLCSQVPHLRLFFRAISLTVA
jgi:hypothetical protein